MTWSSISRAVKNPHWPGGGQRGFLFTIGAESILHRMANSNSLGELCSLRCVGAPDAAGADASRCIVKNESAVSSGRRKGSVAIHNVAEAVDWIRRRGLHV